MEGDTFQTWHFNLFNPTTATLITLTYSWGHGEKVSIMKKSDNFQAPELADERALLEDLVRDPAYGIPFPKS